MPDTFWCHGKSKKIFFPIEINRGKKSIVQSMSPSYIETDASNLRMGLKMGTKVIISSINGKFLLKNLITFVLEIIQ